MAASRETPLSRALAGSAPAPPQAAPLDAYAIARRQFLAGERIEMTAIAAELGISRVTLYRWVGSRGELLGEVMGTLAIRTAQRERRRIRATGGVAIARVAAHLVETLMSNRAMAALLRAEPEFALRVLTTSETNVQARIVDYWTEEIESEVAAGRFEHPVAPRDLAYLIVRLSESFVYKEVLAGEAADPAVAALLFRLILAP
jgi:AcrR family transcriptional regulator